MRQGSAAGRKPAIRRDAAGVTSLGSDWASLTERLIREAQEAGKFDDLPARGRKLELGDQTSAGELALVHHILHNAGFAPPWIEADKQVRALRVDIEAALASARQAGPAARERIWRRLEGLSLAHDEAVARLDSLAPTPRQHRQPIDRAHLRERFDEGRAR